jgi:signal transduction histidine kinase
MMMKQNNKIGWLRILLIVSQLVITGFVIQWLIYQYNDQKQTLKEELERQYNESQEQVIDSLLLKHIVDPAINIRHSSGTDSIHNTIRAVMSITLADSLAVKKGARIPLDMQFQDKEDMLLRTVKLFISQTNDSVHRLEGFSGVVNGEPDTNMFKHVFTEKISDKGLSVAFSWSGDSIGKNHASKESIILLGDTMSNCFPEARIEGLNPMIVRKMSAQILFCLILLILTGSAFIITFVSLKRQLLLNALRNEFVGNISHELKTPVSTVKVALEALHSHDTIRNSEKCDEYVTMASMELNRLEKLVNRVLDQSLLEEKTALENPERIDLNALVAEVIKGFELRAKSENAQLIFDHSEDGLTVSGDWLYINSVLINLIDNSLKYAAPAAEIQVGTYAQKGYVCVSVTDNGPGIPHEYQSRIFEKFFRIPGDNRHNVKGYGLGLTFARQVMKQHGGSISVKNLNTGCRFILSFPATA